MMKDGKGFNSSVLIMNKQAQGRDTIRTFPLPRPLFFSDFTFHHTLVIIGPQLLLTSFHLSKHLLSAWCVPSIMLASGNIQEICDTLPVLNNFLIL